jgi:hypothetical protein
MVAACQHPSTNDQQCLHSTTQQQQQQQQLVSVHQQTASSVCKGPSQTLSCGTKNMLGF